MRDLEKERPLIIESNEIKEQSIGNEMEAINKQIQQLSESSQLGEAKSLRNLDDASTKMRQEHAMEIDRRQGSHQKAIKELNDIHSKTEKSLQIKLSQMAIIEKERLEMEIQLQKKEKQLSKSKIR